MIYNIVLAFGLRVTSEMTCVVFDIRRWEKRKQYEVPVFTTFMCGFFPVSLIGFFFFIDILLSSVYYVRTPFD